MSDSGDVFVIPFQGDLIECTTGLDAVAVKLADGVLSGRENASPVESQRLASILDRYGRGDDAQRLRTEAASMRVGEVVRASQEQQGLCGSGSLVS